MKTEPAVHQDSRARSLLKALSWRVLATLTTASIAFFVIGEIVTAAVIGGIEFFLKFIIYYAHERAWQRVPEFKSKTLNEVSTNS
jgi:uncharacterized membrane protein